MVRIKDISRQRTYMVERFKQYSVTRPKMKKFIGWFLVVFGFLMLVTPLTPGGSLFFVGLEILGLRIIGMDKIRKLFYKKTPFIVHIPEATR